MITHKPQSEYAYISKSGPENCTIPEKMPDATNAKTHRDTKNKDNIIQIIQNLNKIPQKNLYYIGYTMLHTKML